MRKICGADSQLTKHKVKQLQENFFVYCVRSRTIYPTQKKGAGPYVLPPVCPKASTLQDYFPREIKSFAVYVVREETGTNSTDQTS